MKNENFKTVNCCYEISTPCLNMIKGNRPTYDTSKLVHAMMEGEYIPPILVDEDTLTIVDGQNRYMAACTLWKQDIPVKLSVVMHKFANPLLTAIKYNNSSKRWTSANYVEAWIADGNESFTLLKEFVKNCPSLGYKTAVELLYGKGSPSVIPKGTFKTTNESIAKASHIYNEIATMAEIANCELLFMTGIITAWVKVRNNILSQMTWEKWLKTFKKHFNVPGTRKQEIWVQEYYRIQSKVRQKL